MTSYVCFPFQTNLGNMEVIRYTAKQREKDFLQNNTAVLAMEMRRNRMKKFILSEGEMNTLPIPADRRVNSNNKNNSDDNINNNNNSGSNINNFVQPVNLRVRVLQILQRR